MAIRGIDAQHMVTRAAEFMKDSSQQLRKNELLQDYLAVQSKVIDEKDKKTVSRTLETEKTGLHPDQGGGGSAGYGQAQKKSAGKAETSEDAANTVPAGQNIIDIKV